MNVARIYMRVSTDEQDISRQASIIQDAKGAGYYIAGIYREKASGARADRPELLRMIEDLQPGEVVIAEKIDRISRLPLPEAEKLIDAIRGKGAKLAVPGVTDLSELVGNTEGVTDLSELVGNTEGVTKIVLESIQEMLLKLALQIARDDYEDRRRRQLQGIELAKDAGKYRGRKPDEGMHKKIIALRAGGQSIAKTAELAGCSESQVKRIWGRSRKGPNSSV